MGRDHAVICQSCRHVDATFGTPERLDQVGGGEIRLYLKMLTSDHAAALRENVFEKRVGELQIIIRAALMQRL